MTKEQIQTRTRILESLGLSVEGDEATIGGITIDMGTCWPTRLAVVRTLIFKSYELGQIQGGAGKSM